MLEKREGKDWGSTADWLVEDIAKTLKSWGHTGGVDAELIVKSDGEPAIVALREAFIRYHGGIVIPGTPAKGAKAENGLIERGNHQGDAVHAYLPNRGRD